MENKSYDALVAVFQGTLWEAEIIKGLLNSVGVDAMIKDESSLAAVSSGYSETGGKVLVLVNQEEEVYAKKVVAQKSV